MISLILLLWLLCVSAVWVCVCVCRRGSLARLTRLLPHDLGSLPLLGVAHLFFGDGEAKFRSIERIGSESLKKDGIISIRLAHRVFVVIGDPVLAEHAAKTCLAKDDWMVATFNKFISNGHLIAPVPVWRPRRKMIAPAFSTRHLRQFVDIFVEQSNVLAKKLRLKTDQPVAIYDDVITYASNSLFRNFFGLAVSFKPELHQPMIAAVEDGTRILAELFFKPWMQLDFIYRLSSTYRTLRHIIEYGFHYIDQMIISPNKLKKEKKCDQNYSMRTLLDRLMEVEEEGVISNVELKEEVMTLIVAAMETTAVTTGFVCNMLAKHPDVQEKIYEELQQVLCEGESVSAECLPHLKYLTAVIKETLRLFPPIPVVVRQVEHTTELPNGVVLPQGSGVMLHLWAINRNPRYWGADADQFRPERFLDYNATHPAQFAAFSLGPRNCIGYRYALSSLQTLLATLLRQYRVSAVPLTPAAHSEIDYYTLRPTFGIIVKELNKFPIVFHLRNQ